MNDGILQAFRLQLLHDMGALTKETPYREVQRVSGARFRFRLELERALNEPGAAAAYLQEHMYSTPEYANFDRIKTWHYHQTEVYQDAKTAINAAYYARVTKAKRAAARRKVAA